MLESFFKQSKPMLFRRKETIVNPGDANSIFYLSQGHIRLYTISKEGSELTLHIFSAPSLFPILWNKNPTSDGYYFESLTPVEVYKSEAEKFRQFIREKPGTTLEIIQQLSSFSESAIKKLELKIFGDASRQVIAALLNLAECFGKKTAGNTVISYWFTHQDIASITALSRERVTIEINNLLAKKLISYNKHFIVIPEIKLLESELK